MTKRLYFQWKGFELMALQLNGILSDRLPRPSETSLSQDQHQCLN
ncbi:MULTISPECIES: hypothetical protein [Cyanophyceae]|nr:hypothetical protein [Nodosilinea sp. FACHB-141]